MRKKVFKKILPNKIIEFRLLNTRKKVFRKKKNVFKKLKKNSKNRANLLEISLSQKKDVFRKTPDFLFTRGQGRSFTKTFGTLKLTAKFWRRPKVSPPPTSPKPTPG